MAKAKFATPVQKPNVILELTFEEAQGSASSIGQGK